MQMGHARKTEIKEKKAKLVKSSSCSHHRSHQHFKSTFSKKQKRPRVSFRIIKTRRSAPKTSQLLKVNGRIEIRRTSRST